MDGKKHHSENRKKTDINTKSRIKGSRWRTFRAMPNDKLEKIFFQFWVILFLLSSVFVIILILVPAQYTAPFSVAFLAFFFLMGIVPSITDRLLEKRSKDHVEESGNQDSERDDGIS
ncbi:MAG: hypothetical protein E7425_00030 [Ruminococcaceae bacterium]|nr:hypothetical protein [Oscillospiraceae bacterium]